MKNMIRVKAPLLAVAVMALALLTFATQPLKAQNKLLTIDDIFDPNKRVNFNGSTGCAGFFSADVCASSVVAIRSVASISRPFAVVTA